jgi:hypothetical protein
MRVPLRSLSARLRSAPPFRAPRTLHRPELLDWSTSSNPKAQVVDPFVGPVPEPVRGAGEPGVDDPGAAAEDAVAHGTFSWLLREAHRVHGSPGRVRRVFIQTPPTRCHASRRDPTYSLATPSPARSCLGLSRPAWFACVWPVAMAVGLTLKSPPTNRAAVSNGWNSAPPHGNTLRAAAIPRPPPRQFGERERATSTVQDPPFRIHRSGSSFRAVSTFSGHQSLSRAFRRWQ